MQINEQDDGGKDILAGISRFLDKVITCENNKDLDGAEQLLEQITSIFPDILIKYGCLLSSRSKTDEAIDIFTKAITVKPSSIGFNNLACCYALKDDTSKAINSCKKAVELDVDNIDAVSNLAGLYYESNQFDEAIKIYSKILSILSNDSESLLLLSNCYFRKGAYESAILGYQSVLQLDPGNEDAKKNLAASQTMLNKQNIWNAKIIVTA